MSFRERLKEAISGGTGAAREAAGTAGKESGRSFNSAFKGAATRLVAPGAFGPVAAEGGAAGRTAGRSFGGSFKAEAEVGVVGAAKSLAKKALATYGLYFAARDLLSFSKEVVNDAAVVQKSQEVVRAEFGKSATSINEFAHKGGAALGLSQSTVEATAARFGILFKNLGVGKGPAAEMTTGLLKLAGSLSVIRGVDPSIVLRNLPLAVSGNLRSLKQLGIATDQTQLKMAAFKLGLTQSVTQALTPAQRAIAIYAVATAHLGQYQAQAKAHAGDLANEQRRLSSEWANAKETIGKGLLPTFASLTGRLADFLAKEEKTGAIQRDVNSVIKTGTGVIQGFKAVLGVVVPPIKAMIDALGGAKRAVETMLAVFAINKLRSVASTITTSLVKRGILLIGPASEEAAATSKLAFLGIGISAEALGVTIKTALVTTGIGALIVAVGFATTYVLEHWDTVKRYTVALGKGIAATWDGLKTFLIGTGKIIAGSMATSLTLPFRALLEGASKVAGFLGKLHIHIGGGINSALDALKSVTTGLAGSGVKEAARGASEIAGGFSNALHDALKRTPDKTTKDAARKAGKSLGDSTKQGFTDAIKSTGTGGSGDVTTAADRAFGQGVVDAINRAKQRVQDAISSYNDVVKQGQQTLGSFIVAQGAKVTKAATDAQQNLDGIANKLVATVQKFFTAGGGNQKLTGPLEEQFLRLKKELASGQQSPALENALQTVTSQLQEGQAKGFKDLTARKALAERTINDLADEFNKGILSAPQLKTKLDTFLKAQGVTPGSVKGKLGEAFNDKLQALVEAMNRQADAIKKEPAFLRRKGQGGAAEAAGVKVIDPSAVAAAATKAIAARQAQVEDRDRKAAHRISVARHAEAMTVQREHLRVATHHAAEVKRANKAAAARGKKQAKAAATASAERSVDVNTSGFLASGARNTGASADKARTTGKRRLSH